MNEILVSQLVELAVQFRQIDSPDDIGRIMLLSAESFYPEKRIEEKRQKLDEAYRRLTRWFSLSH